MYIYYSRYYRHSKISQQVCTDTDMRMCMLSRFSCVRLSATLWTIALSPWDFSDKNSGVGCPSP